MNKFDWKDWKRVAETEECLRILKEWVRDSAMDLITIEKDKFDREVGRLQGIKETIYKIEELFED